MRTLLRRRLEQFYLGAVSSNQTPRLSLHLMVPRFLETIPLSGPDSGPGEQGSKSPE